jgi:hypothetical protein
MPKKIHKIEECGLQPAPKYPAMQNEVSLAAEKGRKKQKAIKWSGRG